MLNLYGSKCGPDGPPKLKKKFILKRVQKKFFLRGVGWEVHFFLFIKVRPQSKFVFYTGSPKITIFIVQRAYIPKNGLEFRQQTNSDKRTHVATLYELVRRRHQKTENRHT